VPPFEEFVLWLFTAAHDAGGNLSVSRLGGEANGTLLDLVRGIRPLLPLDHVPKNFGGKQGELSVNRMERLHAHWSKVMTESRVWHDEHGTPWE
jgi:hypothetical protein